MMIPENATLFSISLLGQKIRLNVRENATACRREYLGAALGSERCAYPLGRLWSFVCNASKEAVELSVVESSVIFVISDLLTVCVGTYQSADSLTAVITCEFLSLSVDNLCKIYCFLLPVLRVSLHICEQTLIIHCPACWSVYTIHLQKDFCSNVFLPYEVTVSSSSNSKLNL
ncbi:hypothetical protein AVEN_198464-1 [Araneus ventricosus]|uniref:Uncharacterized protein n=1 Tax=Araneus ventricosus TaxID=182803 RepID=A0A4Y2ESW8_ARAVE|nr:hypothetical protein AVEN_198464-1 [Araneus ventricosus]